MAQYDKKSALELHIKVNGQNLSATSEKCNIGTLRLPTDPSWPKIPLRRLTDNTNDIIESPYMVTLTGTPRKGRNIVQTITCQYIKPSQLSQRYEIPTHIPKRLPGCIDPRFKRQILRQKAEKPDESCNMKNDKQMPELDTYVLQKTKKFEDKSWGTREIVDGYTSPCRDINKFSQDVTKLTKETIDCDSIRRQSVLEANHCTMDSYTNNEQREIEDKFSQERKQDSNRSLFLTVDEKKMHTLPIKSLNIGVAPLSAQALQCYSVQVPVIAYHNVSLQVPNISTQFQEDIKIPYKCQSDNAKSLEAIGNIGNGASTLANSMYNSNGSRDETYMFNSIQQCNPTSNDDISGNKNISYCDGHTFDWTRDKEDINLNVSLSQDIINQNSLSEECHMNFGIVNNTDYTKKKDENSLNINTIRKLKSIAKQECNAGSCITNRFNERKKSNERKIAKTWVHPCKIMQKQRFACQVKDSEIDADKYPINIANDKLLEKNIKVLASGEVGNKQHDKSNNEIKEKHKLRTGVKRKATSINLSKRTKSFFRKKSRLAITTSDYTLILPGPRRIKDKRYEKANRHLKASQLLHGRSGINGTNSIRIKSNASKEDRINSCSLTNLRVKDLFEKPSSIPLKTQELLNKSYLEYYWKLNRKIVPAKPDNVEETDKLQDHLPESQMLQQCSILSCMINTALRDSVIADERSLNPTASIMPNTYENVYEAPRSLSVFVKKSKRKRMKRANKRSFGLKTIALLGIAIYVAVIFLPMMYGYIVDEEYDEYENVNYIGLTLQYIASSLEEVFDGIVDILHAKFLHPVPVYGERRASSVKYVRITLAQESKPCKFQRLNTALILQ